MTIEVDNLPVEEQVIFRVITNLNKPEKEVLCNLLQDSNKD
ncbi:hypothetical protein ACERII_12550 [Evansella sp. AB-rgal1]